MSRRRTVPFRVLAAGATLAALSPAIAQIEIYRLPGAAPVPYSHRTVADAGDVDGDGVSDLLLGTYYYTGTVRVHSGRDGSLLRQHDAAAGEAYFGFSMAGLGDIDLDGRADYAIGAPISLASGASGHVHVYSGGTGAPIFTFSGESSTWFNLGWSVAGCGDVDGDGRSDIVMCSGNTLPHPSGGTPGRAYVRSGATGSVIWQIEADASFGPIASVSGAGDLDADGRADFVVGAPWDSNGPGYEFGRVRAYSGRTGSVLWSRAGASFSHFGLALARAGDVDHDGHDDLVVGAPHDEDLAPGDVLLLSGVNGSTLRSWTGSLGGDQFGWSVDGGRDWNGDTVPDVLIGAPQADAPVSNSGAVYVMSGADGSTLTTWGGDPSSSSLGSSVSFADLNFDQRAEVVAQRYDGSASVWLEPPTHTVTCAPRPNSLSCAVTAGVSGTPSLSLVDDLEIGLRGVIAHQRGVLFYGPHGGSVPFHGGTLCIGAPTLRSALLDAGGSTGCTGQFRVPLSQAHLLGAGFAPGNLLHVQFLYRDPGLPYPDNVVTSGSLAVPLLP